MTAKKITRLNVRLPPDLHLAAREAAGVSSKVTKIPEEYWLTVKRASQGLEVDALDLNIACVAAMRTAATRGAQSPSRRDLATKIWNVTLFVQAALEGHSTPRVKERGPKDLDGDELAEFLAS